LFVLFCGLEREPTTSYGSTITDGGQRGGYQSSNDPFAGMANGNYTNLSGRFNEQTASSSIPLTIENPIYRNYQ